MSQDQAPEIKPCKKCGQDYGVRVKPTGELQCVVCQHTEPNLSAWNTEALSQPKDVKRPDAPEWMQDLSISRLMMLHGHQAGEVYKYIKGLEAALEQPTAQGWRPISKAEAKEDDEIWGWDPGEEEAGVMVLQRGRWVWQRTENLAYPTHFFALPTQPPRSEVSNG